MRIPIFDRRVINHFDVALLMFVVPLVFLSLYLVGEVSENLFKKQMAYTVLATIIFWVVFFVPIRKITWLIPFFYWFAVSLLIFVDFFGVIKLGARRWIEIPFINLTLQPSEIFKPALILMLAYLIERNPPPPDGYSWGQFFKLSFYILLPFFLIMQEPDLGTASMMFLLGFGVLLAVGVRRKIWIILFVLTAITSPIIYDKLHDYQKQRIYDFVSEKPSYHVQQSIIAIGSGGLLGKPKDDATQTQLRFLPIATSDFIFAYYVERFGFLGAVFLVLMYAMLILHLFTLTRKTQDDYFSSVVIVGVGVLIFLYMAVNISMTIGLVPVVGVPLPIFSHGGSSFINFMVLFAIIENLLAFRFNFLYNSRTTFNKGT